MSPLVILFLVVAAIMTYSIGVRLISAHYDQIAHPVYDIEVFVTVASWLMVGYLTLSHR